jgi:hypothetical protein
MPTVDPRDAELAAIRKAYEASVRERSRGERSAHIFDLSQTGQMYASPWVQEEFAHFSAGFRAALRAHPAPEQSAHCSGEVFLAEMHMREMRMHSAEWELEGPQQLDYAGGKLPVGQPRDPQPGEHCSGEVVEAVASLRGARDALASAASVPIADPYILVELRALCERAGYGNVMSSASALWRERLGDLAGGEFVSAPCRSTAVNALAAVDAAIAALSAPRPDEGVDR